MFTNRLAFKWVKAILFYCKNFLKLKIWYLINVILLEIMLAITL